MTTAHKEGFLAVFSGSGTLYPLHLGALSYVERELGWNLRGAAGVSGGALAASLRALHEAADESLLEILLQDKPSWKFWDLSLTPWRTWSVFGGRNMRRMLRRRFKGPLSSSSLPLKLITTPLSGPDRSPKVWDSAEDGAAPWADVVAASMSIPGAFPPVRLPDGRLHVDGGVLNNLPIDAWGLNPTPVQPLVVFQVSRSGGREQEPRNGLEYAVCVLDDLIGNSSRELLDQMPAGSLLVRLEAPPHQRAVIDLNLTSEEVLSLWLSGWRQAQSLLTGV